MKKVRIGVLGAYRGTSMINYCKRSDNAEVVAICDKLPEALEAQRQNADTIDVYEALDMFLPGMFAYRSVLKGGIPMEIPNLRDKAVREQWRNDTACTDPAVAGDQLLPVFSKGTPDIEDGVYEHMKNLWQAECETGTGNYRSAAFSQGAKK